MTHTHTPRPTDDALGCRSIGCEDPAGRISPERNSTGAQQDNIYTRTYVHIIFIYTHASVCLCLYMHILLDRRHSNEPIKETSTSALKGSADIWFGLEEGFDDQSPPSPVCPPPPPLCPPPPPPRL